MGAQIAKTTAEQLIDEGMKQVAINLIIKGHTNEVIIDGTGLNVQQINELRKQFEMN